MTFIEHGIQGAFRQTWRKGNPRSLLQTIIEKNPKADLEEIYSLFWNEIEGDKQLLMACVSYWLDLNYKAILRADESKQQPLGRTAHPVSADEPPVVAKLRERIEHEATLVLLELVMPNGKPLGDCTGTQCRKFGGLFAQLAKHVPRQKTVRSVLKEADVQKLWQAAMKADDRYAKKGR
jgi:hypothetical protein